jgi:hypothetical protein
LQENPVLASANPDRDPTMKPATDYRPHPARLPRRVRQDAARTLSRAFEEVAVDLEMVSTRE